MAVPEHSHPGESQSNGLAERAIREVVDHIRVLKLALETHLNVRIPSNHPVMAWLVEHAAYLLNRCQLGTDGRTPWGRLHGKEASEKMDKALIINYSQALYSRYYDAHHNAYVLPI